MNTNIQGQYEGFDIAINGLKENRDTIKNIFDNVKREFEEMPYQSQEASKLRNVFNQQTVTEFNKCCDMIANYITCLENAKKEYLVANQETLN